MTTETIESPLYSSEYSPQRPNWYDTIMRKYDFIPRCLMSNIRSSNYEQTEAEEDMQNENLWLI